MALAEHGVDVVAGDAGHHQGLGPGGLDDDDLAVQAVAGLGQLKVLGPDTVDDGLAVLARGAGGQRLAGV